MVVQEEGEQAGVQEAGGQHAGQQDHQVHHATADAQAGQAQELALSRLVSVISGIMDPMNFKIIESS